MLRQLLRLKFPDVPESALAPLDHADGHRLDTWTARALTAKTLQEVLSRTVGEALFDEGLERGLEQGRLEGQRSVVQRLLLLKFPHVSIAPLNKATEEQLDVWGERILTAATGEEVFAP
jgi:hypothetical protein